VTNVDISEKHYNINFIPYSVSITVLEPFMYAETVIEESREANGILSEVFTVTAGNERPLPFILIECGASTSITSISVDVN
jgi:hypothetical protein